MSDSMDKDTVKLPKWLIGGMFAVGCGVLGQIFVSAQWAARIEQKQEFMAQSLAEFKQEVKEGTANRYTSVQAATDQSALLRLYDGLEKRIAINELRIRELEKKP